jgi:hypothetical protein
MNKSVKQVLFWTPRVAGLLFILFISLFALDVFETGSSLGAILLALLMHLLPSIALAVALGMAWRWEWIGAVAFGGFAIWYVATARGFPLVVYGLLAGIPLVIGMLFAAGWVYRQQIRQTIG